MDRVRETSEEVPIPVGHKFGAVALTQTRSRLRAPCRLTDDLLIFPESPFALDEFWTKWVGTNRRDQIAKSNLVIVAHAPTGTPDILDGDNKRLKDSAHRYFICLLLAAVPAYDKALHFSGVHKDGGFEIRELGSLANISHPYDVENFENFVFIDENHLKTAHAVMQKMASIFVEESEAFARLRQGLNAYWKAASEGDVYYRLPQLVRALEAILIPRIGKSRANFTHRMQTFLQPRPGLANELSLIYELRSRLLHIQPVEELFPSLAPKDVWPAIWKLTCRIELVTRDLLRYIVLTDDIRRIFLTDDTLESFWKLQDHERMDIWNERLAF